MSWSIADVARMSNVTSRTLRHYDAIGLLPPAWTAAGGRRYYEREQLLRLQQVLLLRELGLGLEAIGDVLAAQSEASTVEVLRRHRALLLAEHRRLGRLVETVTDTIEDLEKGNTMAVEKMFEGFDPGQFGGFDPEQYVDEARERWGDSVDESISHVQRWTSDDWAGYKSETVAVNDRIAELFDAGVPVDDPRVLDAVDAHFRLVSRFWKPNRESYTGLGRMYVDDSRFAKNYEDVREGLTVYMRDAMKAYADARLT
ncbi:MAG TPA: TipAS antibiotic-recognition domain-containing protein [Jiangellaceae bacterium]|nr:TipAS antibiotic-recognition domain-containing protein [Jiangellaceae bacterium]